MDLRRGRAAVAEVAARGTGLVAVAAEAGLPAKPSRLRPKVPGLEKVLRGRSVRRRVVAVGAR